LTFPQQHFASIAGYFDAYADELARAAASVSREALDRAQALLTETLRRDGQVWSCGNGGSAAIANHLVCDHTKGVSTDTGLHPRIHSLSATIEVITAIANDIAYDDVFAEQLRLMGRPGDLLITISSSGNSENVVRAIRQAKTAGMATVALTGFAGGRSAVEADVNLHVAADNYGVVEDLHQALMHVLAQYIRLAHMPPSLIGQRRF